MARRFKRRKPRVAWLPTFGGAPIEAAEFTAAPWAGVQAQINFDVVDPPEDGIYWDAQPLTFDVTEDSVAVQQDPTKVTLRDIVQGNEWRLRRIVGKAFISCANRPEGPGQLTTAWDVALGFIVCKTYDDGTPLTDFNEVNPLTQPSMEDPWIWRRRWVLADNADSYGIFHNLAATSTQVIPRVWGYPTSTVGYGSVSDGPHIDSKIQRRIHRSERLFAVLAGRRYYGEIDTSELNGFAPGQINMLLDYRLLGSLGSQQYGNRGNTSR